MQTHPSRRPTSPQSRFLPFALALVLTLTAADAFAARYGAGAVRSDIAATDGGTPAPAWHGDDGQRGQSTPGDEESETQIAGAAATLSLAAAGGSDGKGQHDDEQAQDSKAQAEGEAGPAGEQAQAEAAEPVHEDTESAAVSEHASTDHAPAGDCAAKAVEESGHGHHAHWSYEGDSGPEHWAELSPEYETCGTGTRQTPIDVQSSEAVAMGLEDIQFHYGSTDATVVNNGHTIQVNVGEGNTIDVDGVTYSLAQFHFHTPSEHTIDGNSYPLELHLVHKDDNGNLAVVGVMIEKGEKNPALSQVWKKLPKAEGKQVALKEQIDLNMLLPGDLSAYRYVGSLTTPPCSEGVKWIVMKSSVTLTTKQITAFKKVFPMNARPLQPLNARSVLIDVTNGSHASN